MTVEHQSIPNTVTTTRPTSRTCRAAPTSCSSRRSRPRPPRRSRPARRAGQEGEGVRRRRFGRRRRVQGAGNYLSSFGPTSAASRLTSRSSRAGRRTTPRRTRLLRPVVLRRDPGLLKAIKLACTAGHGTIPKRSAVITDMKKVTVQNWINGGRSSSPRSTPRIRRTRSSTSCRSSPTARTSRHRLNLGDARGRSAVTAGPPPPSEHD